MPFKIADRVKETSATTGTGDLTLAGAVVGFRTFAAALSDGDTVPYAIHHRGTADWETGIGTFGAAGPTLSRDAVLESSNSGSLVNFSAGTKDVGIAPLADRTIVLDASPGKSSTPRHNGNAWTALIESFNVALYGEDTNRTTRAAAVQAAINAASGTNTPIVYVPENFLDYDASAVTFDSSVLITRQGGNPNYFDLMAYGGHPDAADNEPAWSACIEAIMGTQGSVASQGGVLYVPPGTFVLTTDPGTLPNDGATGQAPLQTSIKILGAGSFARGNVPADADGSSSVLDLQYSATNGKITTLGAGLLEAEGVTFMDSGGDNTPFFYSTNTTLRVHDCGFFGSKSGVNCDQDVFVLGGTVDQVGESADDQFSGYGTVIRDNWSNQIRRLVHGRMHANGVSVVDNTVWVHSGTNLVGGAAIEFDGDPNDVTGSGISGINCHGNLIEVQNYVYGVKLRAVVASTIGPNNFYDPGGSFSAFYRCEAEAQFNIFIAGFHPDTDAFLSEVASVANKNSALDGHQSQETVWTQAWTFKSAADPLKIVNPSSTNASGPIMENQNGDQLYWRAEVGDRAILYHKPNGGSAEQLLEVRDFGSGVVITKLMGSDTRIRSEAGLIKLDDDVRIDGATDFNQPGGDGTGDPTTDAPTDWIEVTVQGATRYIPVYT